MPRQKREERKSPLLVPASAAVGSLRRRMAECLEWMAVHQYTADSVHGRAKSLDRFATWCDERNLARPEEVSRAILERYQRHLFLYRKKNGQPLGPGTQVTLLMPVKVFFRWLTRQNYLLYNPASELVMPRVPRRLPKAILSVSEVERILALPDVATPLGIRDRAMMETLYSTGVRRKELVALNVFALDAERGTLMVRQGKGRKDRVVPIGDRAIAWVRKYVDEVRPRWAVQPDEGYLFLTADGQHFDHGHLSSTVRWYVEKADVKGKRGSCHLFRHSMATQMLEGGADIRFIQALLGHEKLDTTQIYTQVSIRKLKEIHTATHPCARLERRAPDDEPAAEPLPEHANEAELLAALAAEADDDEDELPD